MLHKRTLILIAATLVLPTSIAGLTSAPVGVEGMLKTPIHPAALRGGIVDAEQGGFFFGIYSPLPDGSVTYAEPAPITSDIVCSTTWTHSNTKSGTTPIDYSLSFQPPVRPEWTYQILGSYAQGWIRLTSTDGASETVDQYNCPGTWELAPFVDAKINQDPGNSATSTPALPAHWRPLYFTNPTNVAPGRVSENANVNNHLCLAVVFRAEGIPSINTPFTGGIHAGYSSELGGREWNYFTVVAGKQFSLFTKSSGQKSDSHCTLTYAGTTVIDNSVNPGEIPRPSNLNQPPMGGWSVEWYACDGDSDKTDLDRKRTCKDEWASVVVSS